MRWKSKTTAVASLALMPGAVTFAGMDIAWANSPVRPEAIGG